MSFAALCFCLPLFSQSPKSVAIQGSIADPSGAVIAGASVTAINLSTGLETSRSSSEAGVFVRPLLPADVYTVTVNASGFQILNQANIAMDALANVGLNLVLQIGSANQSVTVDAALPLLKSDDATRGSAVNDQVYAALPLAMNGVARDPTQFTSLVPGVTAYTTQVSRPVQWIEQWQPDLP